jgi:hypothetical protein
MEMATQSIWIVILFYWFFYFYILYSLPFFFYSDEIKQEVLDSFDQNSSLGWGKYYGYSIASVWYRQLMTVMAGLILFFMFLLMTFCPLERYMGIFVTVIIIGISFCMQYVINNFILKIHDKYIGGERRIKMRFCDRFILYGHTPRKFIIALFFISAVVHAILMIKVCFNI